MQETATVERQKEIAISVTGAAVTDKKIEARILSVFIDERPWQAVYIKKGNSAEVL